MPTPAFAMDLILDYAESTEDAGLRQLVTSRAKALYGVDIDCPLTYEPSASDFLSPCLQEAVLMSLVLEQSEFVSWHDSFLPAADSPDFGVLAERVQLGESVAEDGGLMGAKSHLIGLAFTRAEGLSRLAAALGSEHPSFAAYRSTAAAAGRPRHRSDVRSQLLRVALARHVRAQVPHHAAVAAATTY